MSGNLCGFLNPALVLVALVLTGCGGGGGSDDTSSGTSSSNSSSGSVGLLLTDGFTDQLDAVNITITNAQLLSDAQPVTVFQGNKTFNLLEYRNDSQLFSFDSDVPVGTYNKIRLTVSDIELVKCENSNGSAYNVQNCTNTIAESDQPRLTANQKLDLNPRGDFNVLPGGVLMIELDIDAEKSISIKQTGNGRYQFRPVVFVKVISDVVTGKLLRLHGVIDDLDLADNEFELCSNDVALLLGENQSSTNTTCVEIEYNSNTSFFGGNGLAMTAQQLVEREQVTVIGRWREDRDDDDDDDNDDGHEIDGVSVQAIVVEAGSEGTFTTLDGTSLSPLNILQQFTMQIAPGQGFIEGTELTVVLQNTTQLVDRMGNRVQASSIANTVPVSVDGILQMSGSTATQLTATLIVVDTLENSSSKLSGVISMVPDQSCGLMVQTSEGDRSVRTTADTTVLLVDDDNDAQQSQAIEISDLAVTNVVDVYGSSDSQGCFNATSIVVFGDDD